MLFGDAEEEFDWNGPFSRDNISTTAIASLPDATRRFNERGLVPIYLVDYPVVANPESAAIIARMVADGACDIGTQLHPWVNPPFDEAVTPHNSYTANLPRALQRAKLHALTDKIAEVVGRRPIVYRAGRYGIGPETGDLLAEAGYRMDVSIRALFDYRAQHGPDFSRHPIWPWWVSDDVLEIPLTSAFTGLLRSQPRLHDFARARGVFARSGLLNRASLTPEGTPIGEALAAIRQMLDAGVSLFSLSFHTPSIEIGHTPYVRDQADLRRFWQWWDAVFDLFARENVRPARLDEALDAAR